MKSSQEVMSRFQIPFVLTNGNARNVGFETHNGGQFTLSTQLRYQITLLYSPTDAAPQFLKKPNPFNPLNPNSD